jgi:hypothetical protein
MVEGFSDAAPAEARCAALDHVDDNRHIPCCAAGLAQRRGGRATFSKHSGESRGEAQAVGLETAHGARHEAERLCDGRLIKATGKLLQKRLEGRLACRRRVAKFAHGAREPRDAAAAWVRCHGGCCPGAATRGERVDRAR